MKKSSGKCIPYTLAGVCTGCCVFTLALLIGSLSMLYSLSVGAPMEDFCWTEKATGDTLCDLNA